MLWDIQILNNFQTKKKRHTKKQCVTRAVFDGQKNVTQSISRGYESTAKANDLLTCNEYWHVITKHEIFNQKKITKHEIDTCSASNGHVSHVKSESPEPIALRVTLSFKRNQIVVVLLYLSTGSHNLIFPYIVATASYI